MTAMEKNESAAKNPFDSLNLIGLRKYIDRGWISNDEYEDLFKYLYEPYTKMGGNGTAKRLMEEVGRLPIRNIHVQQRANVGTAQPQPVPTR